MKKKLFMILSYVLSLALALNLFPIITFAGSNKITSWDELKSALESGKTDICLESDAVLKATSDIEVVIGKDVNVRVYAIDTAAFVDMNHTNYSIHLSGEGKITFENIAFSTYSNPCIDNQNSAYLQIWVQNCSFTDGDGPAINGKNEERTAVNGGENGLSVGASYDLNGLLDLLGIEEMYIEDQSDTNKSLGRVDVEVDPVMVVGENQTINFTTSFNSSGNISFGLLDVATEETYYSSILPVIDGKSNVTISDLPAGNFQVISVYGGDDHTNPAASINNLSIFKWASVTNVTAYQNNNGQMDINVNVDGNQQMVNLDGLVDVEVYQLLDRQGKALTNVTQSSVKSILICNGTSELNEGTVQVNLEELEEGVYSVQAYLRDNPFFEDSCGEVRIKVLRGEEPTTEPPTEEPTTEEPTTEEPTTEEPTTEEPTTEEPTTEEPTTEEPTTEEPTTEEPTTEEPTTEEPTTEEPTTEEPTTVEQTTEEITTAEPTTVELTRAEFTTVESVTTAPETTVRKTEENDPKGSVYRVLQLKQDKVSKKSLKIKWRKVKGAKTYVIYGSKCGLTRKCKKIAKTKKLAYTIKKLKKGTYYKFTVKALDEHNKVISVSKLAHIATDGGKKGNDKVVKVNAKQVSLNAGKTFKIKAKAIPKSKDQKVNRHRAIKYESDNQGIATVNQEGVITGKSKGTCIIYVYTQNGFSKKVYVTVK